MSYLLTEIALDMLGYKFYDINGTYQITDFQSMSSKVPEDSEEISLEDLIYPKDEGNVQRKNRDSVDSDECVEVPPNQPTPKTHTNQDQRILQNIKESVEKEIEVLREEIYFNKTKFIEDNVKIIRKRDKTAKISPADILKPYSERERENIRNEAEMLGEFLKCVEKSLEDANPEQFKELKRYRMEEFLGQ